MATSTLTPAAKARAAQLRAYLDITGPTQKLQFGAWNVLVCRVGDEDMPKGVETAMYGVNLAKCGRISGMLAMHLRSLSDWQWCNLLAEIAVDCKVCGEVPAFLNRWWAARS